jgi:hypothetical protein
MRHFGIFSIICTLGLLVGWFGYTAAAEATGYGSSVTYVTPNWVWYSNHIVGTRFWPAGYYTHVNGVWYRRGFGVEVGISLGYGGIPQTIVLPPTITIPQFPAGVPAVMPPAEPKPAAPALSPEDITLLKALLQQVREQQAQPGGVPKP